MKYIFSLLLLTTSANAAEGDIGLSLKNNDKTVVSAVNINLEQKINEHFSIYNYTSVQSNNFGESYFGPYYSNNNFSIWAAAGIQQSNNIFASQFNLGFKVGNKNYLKVDTEFDPSLIKNSNSIWYDVIYSHNLSDEFNIGLRSRRNIGSGLYFNINYKLNIVLCWLPFNQEFIFNTNKVFDYTRFYSAIKVAF